MKTKQTVLASGLAAGLAVLMIAAGLLTGCSAGDDDPALPVEIDDLAGLKAIGGSAEGLRKNYKLMADIAGLDESIGISGTPFTGNFDGNGHKITLNITGGKTISSGGYTGTCAGLFAAIGGRGSVHDLTVEGTINISGVSGNVAAGGAAGAAVPGTVISRVASSVTVSAGGNGDVLAGGIVGAGQGTISNVYTTGNISATTSGATEAYAGGIAGVTLGAVSYAYATGGILAKGTGTGEGTGEGKITIGAGGIAGAANSASVHHTVALNSGVEVEDSSSYNRCANRIASSPSGPRAARFSANHGKADLSPTGGSHSPDKTATGQDGKNVPVTPGSPYTAPNQDWWTGTGFSGANWAAVWEWDSAKGLPVLR
ncbi:MAG: hypothetical protein LBO80_11680 [Treponema sp.]|jgi:hypothetical protein|nr:hypothetical protein [Treponema sp.]